MSETQLTLSEGMNVKSIYRAPYMPPNNKTCLQYGFILDAS